jgi:hypothetical protein
VVPVEHACGEQRLMENLFLFLFHFYFIKFNSTHRALPVKQAWGEQLLVENSLFINH